jgi:hypothetical protein
MKRKRIQYNELNEEIYSPMYWTRTRLIASGLVILLFGFLFNFSLEEKINKWLLATLSSNEACPIIFEKAELSYFLPTITIVKPIILGSCFGQINNRLPLQDFKIAISGPSFYPPGINLHVIIHEGRTKLNLYPTLSPFSQYVEIDDSILDAQIFGAMTDTNKSPINGTLLLKGSLKFSGNTVEDGALSITSNNLRLPAQNIKGFDMTEIVLNRLSIQTHFINKSTMQIDEIAIGKPGMPIDLKLKGSIQFDPNVLMASQLKLAGTLHLSNFILTNFSFIKLFLPESNTSGTYQMNLSGPLGNLGPPQFK